MEAIKKAVLLLILIAVALGAEIAVISKDNVGLFDNNMSSNTGVLAASSNTKIVGYNADGICDAVKTNKDLRIGIRGYYDSKRYYFNSPTDTCNNTSAYTKRESQIKKGEAYVRYGRAARSSKIYADDVLVKNANSYGSRAYFFVSNRPKTGTGDSLNSLKPGEKTFLYLDVSGKGVKSNTYGDLRLFVVYGNSVAAADVTTYRTIDADIAAHNSIAFFVHTNKSTYGPYAMADAEYDNYYKEQSSDGSNKMITTYKLISKNLVGGIPASESIKGIEIYPYYNHTIAKGLFRLFSLSLYGYSSYGGGNSYVSANGAEDAIRHNVVNNMLENATVKWNMSGGTTLHFYHHFVTEPIIIKPSSKQNYYGIPYVNTVNSTIGQFTHHGTVNNVATAKKKNTAYFSYKLADTFQATVTSNHGKKFNAGSAIPNKTLYINEAQKTNDKIGTRKTELQNGSLQFIPNSFGSKGDGYYLGLDCSSSIYLAVGRDVATLSPMADSSRYFSNGQVSMLGGLSVSADKVEKYLRKKGSLKNNQHMTSNVFKLNYSTYIKTTYGNQKIYNGYALALPGDIIDKYGHVRMVSGYSHVVCKKDGVSTDKYKNGFCNAHGGINPDKSYVITTEVGTRHQKVYQRDATHIAASKTGWKYTLNPQLTDLKSVDDLYNKNKGLLSIFKVNLKYSFTSLLNSNYYAFRYKTITNNIAKNKIEKPVARLVLDKSYNNLNQTLYDYFANNKRLKGTLFTNYVIDAIRVEINGTKYYEYPRQTTIFSFYSDIVNTKITNAIKNLNYKNKNSIKISVKIGPNISAVRTAAGADSSGYIKILDTTNLTANIIVKSTSVKLNKTSLSVLTGKTTSLTATVAPSSTTNKAVTWKSSNTNVATVSASGVVKGVGNGKATITVKTNDTGKTTTATVTVTTAVTSVKLSKTSTTINTGKTEKLEAIVSPKAASNKAVTWKSSNTSVATVTSTGTITAKGVGTATITATTNDGGKSASATVTVVKPTVSVTGIEVSKTSVSLLIGATEKITATVRPSNVTNKAVTWTSNNTSVATVTGEGTIVAEGVGTATITATTNDGGKKATVSVTVSPIRVQSITLSKNSATLEVGETSKISATVLPSNATNKAVTWTSNNTSVATVTSTGTITAKGVGTATITATTNDGGKKATVSVTVFSNEIIKDNGGTEDEAADDDIDVIPTASVKLNTASATINVGNTVALTATVSPSNATNKAVTWMSSDSNVATVSASGVVKGVSAGTATITVKTKDAGNSAMATITVKKSSSKPSGSGSGGGSGNSGEKSGGNGNSGGSGGNGGSGNSGEKSGGNGNSGGSGGNGGSGNSGGKSGGNGDGNGNPDNSGGENGVENDPMGSVSETVRVVVVSLAAVTLIGGGALFVLNKRK
ncbi:Ig domain-containing protein [Candidatus Saccharibacteria bacterium]|nr:Ig domain-containing protein [Candidatus Saccharibacteria bacterium]